jgi:hypothetical protein
VLRLPSSLIHHDAQGPFVYVDRAGRIAVARPTFGLSGKDHVEVLDGLGEGEAVLAGPASKLQLPVGRRWVAAQ